MTSRKAAGSAERPESGRARPLPPDERRAMLVAATLPLLAEHGTRVTTRQIAQAAGIAEGTIFRVFTDKEELIRTAIDQALDPTQTMTELLGVDEELPLRERMVALTEILRRRLIQVFNVMIALRPAGPDKCDKPHAGSAPGHEQVLHEIIRLLWPDRDKFRWPVPEVARVLRLLIFAGSHPLVTGGCLLSAEEIVSVVLDGVVRYPLPPDSEQPTSEQPTSEQPGADRRVSEEPGAENPTSEKRGNNSC